MSEQEYSIVSAAEAHKISRNIGAVILWRPVTSKQARRPNDNDPCELRNSGDPSLLPQREMSL
jgi:hypothetical protein